MDMIIFWLIFAGLCASRGGALFGGRTATDWLFSMPPSVVLKDGDKFDYVVVGAGGAGAALAARLALAGEDVLLIEAGEDPTLLSKIPSAAPVLMGSNIDWQYDTISNNVSCLSSRNKQCRFSRGKCLGGSTTINYMMYVRGNPKDYDNLNIPGWAWKDLEPYFLKYEGLQDLPKLPPSSIPYHNTKGTMKVEFFADPQNPWHSRLVDGFKDLNVPFNPDVNAQSQIGVTQVIGYVYENERMSTARGYLAREDVKKALKVAKGTRCTSVIIDEDNTARGVTVVQGLFQRKLNIYANKEVILSAGTVGTPQILMLSGIGHAQHLKEMNIKVRAELPVGDNMTDHLLPLVFVKVDYNDKFVKGVVEGSIKVITDVAQLLLLSKGPLASNGLTDISIFLNSKCYDFKNRQLTNNSTDCELPSLQFINAFIDRNLVFIAPDPTQKRTDLNDYIIQQLKKLSPKYAFITMTPVILQPFSQGTVRLASSDPMDPPAILPNFLSDDRDLEAMVKSITIIEHLMETPTFMENNASIVLLDLPGCSDYKSDRLGYWQCYSRHMTHTVFHAVGTAAIGRVVDARLRVRGVRGLRVADLSVMPRLPRGNTGSCAIAIGERMADLILKPEKCC